MIRQTATVSAAPPPSMDQITGQKGAPRFGIDLASLLTGAFRAVSVRVPGSGY